MAWQVVRQPSGLYAIWSTVVDNFVVVDCSREEVIEEFIACEAKRIREGVGEKIDALDRGEKPYHQFTKSFDECVASIRKVHGEKSLEWMGLETTGREEV